MGGDALPLQRRHQQIAHLVIDGPFSLNCPLFLAVKGGGVILVGYDEQPGIMGAVDLLCLALVEQILFFHDDSSIL